MDDSEMGTKCYNICCPSRYICKSYHSPKEQSTKSQGYYIEKDHVVLCPYFRPFSVVD